MDAGLLTSLRSLPSLAPMLDPSIRTLERDSFLLARLPSNASKYLSHSSSKWYLAVPQLFDWG